MLLVGSRKPEKKRYIILRAGLFGTPPLFNILSAVILIILVIFYALWW
jgi:uncharacterized membrane protein